MGFCFDKIENRYSIEGLIAIMHRWGKGNFQPFLDNVSQSEFYLLLGLQHNFGKPGEQGVRTMDLADVLYVSAPAISRTLGNLEKKGLVIRYIDKEDKRNSYATLSEEGAKVVEESLRRLMDFFDSVICEMGKDRFHEMIDLMYCFNDSLNTVIKKKEENKNV